MRTIFAIVFAYLFSSHDVEAYPLFCKNFLQNLTHRRWPTIKGESERIIVYHQELPAWINTLVEDRPELKKFADDFRSLPPLVRQVRLSQTLVLAGEDAGKITTHRFIQYLTGQLIILGQSGVLYLIYAPSSKSFEIRYGDIDISCFERFEQDIETVVEKWFGPVSSNRSVTVEAIPVQRRRYTIPFRVIVVRGIPADALGLKLLKELMSRVEEISKAHEGDLTASDQIAIERYHNNTPDKYYFDPDEDPH